MHNQNTSPVESYLRRLHSLKSRRVMRSFIKKIANILGETTIELFPWHSLRSDHIFILMDKLRAERMAPTTLKAYFYAIRGVIDEAWNMHLISTEDYQRIKKSKINVGSRLTKGRSLESEEIGTLLDNCEEDNAKNCRDAAIIAVMRGCGLRRSEVVFLNYEDLNFEELKISIIGKGNKERELYLPDRVFECLKLWLDKYRGLKKGALFTRIWKGGKVSTKRLSDQAILYILQDRASKTCIKSFSPHDMRRTFATTLLANGEDLGTVRDLMGHTNVQTTLKYDKRGEGRLKEASKKIKF